ncbi:hypothetical protein CKO15_03405 [Halorhodospira abdelmalekii]|uniref:Nudix family hydrolase n=1 Tax=Halorhodospira abdelmalekii TaxID=421629 RepID=UPI001907E590|nr:Nudix family hydrolase [Halorhodospira abdelmalekii]MBK1734345.1 hypothetical protein [Halorhodospira abdelmalekii]
MPNTEPEERVPGGAAVPADPAGPGRSADSGLNTDAGVAEHPVEPLSIAVGVLRDGCGRVLAQRRPQSQRHAGLWEFPGGKVEPGEGVTAALQRELQEELAVAAIPGAPLIEVPWDYGDGPLRLYVLDVRRWRGEPSPQEGQELDWIAPERFGDYPWLVANRPILRALQLPDCQLITPQQPARPQAWLEVVTQALAAGVRLVQMRRHDLSDPAFARLATALLERCRAYGARLLLNRDVEMVERVGADGLHLTAAQLAQMHTRPPGVEWLGASCHGASELAQAAALGVDFALLSPVSWTPSHPERQPLGWRRFAELVATVPLPVYALGGLTRADRFTARAHGGQGVAAIRGLLADDAAASPPPS